jgi:hypothetical protein
MSDKNNEEEIENIWHGQQENILKRWGEIGSSYRFMHDRSYLYYEKQNFRFALPVIVISTITGTANFAQASFPASWQTYVPLVIGFFNLSAGLITTIAQFLRVSELLEGHRSASIAYSKFSRNISVELSLPVDERSCSGREFIAARRIELDRLIEQSPNVPLHIVKLFGKKFEKSAFIKPDILEITGVEVYKDDKKTKEIQKLKELELKSLEIKIERDRKAYEEGIIQKIREDETKRQNEFDKKLKEKILEAKENMVVNKRMRAQEKKKKIGFHSVAKSMSSLIRRIEDVNDKNDIITPDSSDMDDESPRINSKIQITTSTILEESSEEDNEIENVTSNNIETVIDEIEIINETNTDNIIIDISDNLV